MPTIGGDRKYRSKERHSAGSPPAMIVALQRSRETGGKEVLPRVSPRNARSEIERAARLLATKQAQGVLPTQCELLRAAPAWGSFDCINGPLLTLTAHDLLGQLLATGGHDRREDRPAPSRPRTDGGAPAVVRKSASTSTRHSSLDRVAGEERERNNGRVGITGVSYPGWLTLMGIIEPHPALKAAVPMYPMVDGWIGDDFYHNGALRQTMFEWIYNMGSHKSSDYSPPFGYRDMYEAFLSAGSADAVARRYKADRLPTWRKIVDNPSYNAFWRGQAVQDMLAKPAESAGAGRPRPVRSGGQLRRHRRLSRARGEGPPNDMVYLAVGPWNHGQSQHEGSSLGALRGTRTPVSGFARRCCSRSGISTSRAWRPRSRRRRWWRSTPVRMSGRPTELARRRPVPCSGSIWPRREACPFKHRTVRERAIRGIRVRSGQAGPVSRAAGSGDVQRGVELEAVAGRRSAPVRRSHRRADVRQRAVHRAVDDQRRGGRDALRVDHRHRQRLGGEADRRLPARGALESGAGRLSTDGVRRHPARPLPREPGDAATAMPDEVAPYRVRMPEANHTFLPGHRIMVQVQSSWFPLYDRNPQTFVENIAKAQPGDYRAATQRIWFTPDQASYVELPVVSDSARQGVRRAAAPN